MSAGKINMKKIKSLLKKDNKPPLDNHVVTKIVRPSGIKLSIVSGRIEKEETDVIVNSLSASLNVDHGILSSSISAKAGPGLQVAIQETQESAHYGDVIKTPGFKLRAKAVYHVVIAAFNYPGAGDVLENLIVRCLDLAEHDKWTSISIPALGTGRHQFPPFAVAHRMIEAVRRYEQKYGNLARLKKIRFIMVESRNTSAFQTALAEIPNSSQRHITDTVKNLSKSSFRQSKQASVPSPSDLKNSSDYEDSQLFADDTPPATRVQPGILNRKSSFPQKTKSFDSAYYDSVSDELQPSERISKSMGATRPLKKPTTLNLSVGDRISKALQKNKTFKKERALSRLRSFYRELPKPTQTLTWRYIRSTKRETVTEKDMESLVNSLAGPEAHRKRKTVLLHGLSFVGKSTLVHRITRQWADGGLDHIRLIVLVNLKVLISLASLNIPLTLRDAVSHCLLMAGLDEESVADLFTQSRGKILLILDDVEAWAEHFSSEIPLDPLFSKAHIIATSRTSTAVKLADAYSPMVTVELQGFCPELLSRFLNAKCKEAESSQQILNGAEILLKFSRDERNRNMLHPPGIIELALEVLGKPKSEKSTDYDVETLMRLGPLMENYISQCPKRLGPLQSEKTAKFGEAVLKFLSHKPGPLNHIPIDLDIYNKGSCHRWMFDYGIAVHFKQELEKKGKVYYLNAADLEGIFTTQTSLEIACGFSASTSEYIHRMIAQTASADPAVVEARQHVLDENDQDGARVLKRLHDLQASCLRQSNTRLLEDTDVPDELQYLGAEYSRVYLMACEQGTKEMHHTRVMIVGHFGAGKTSLKRCLVREKFNPEYNVTNAQGGLSH